MSLLLSSTHFVSQLVSYITFCAYPKKWLPYIQPYTYNVSDKISLSSPTVHLRSNLVVNGNGNGYW